MQETVPVIGTEIDTDDPASSAANVGIGVALLAMLFGMVAAAKYGVSEIKSTLNVGDGQSTEGV